MKTVILSPLSIFCLPNSFNCSLYSMVSSPLIILLAFHMLNSKTYSGMWQEGTSNINCSNLHLNSNLYYYIPNIHPDLPCKSLVTCISLIANHPTSLPVLQEIFQIFQISMRLFSWRAEFCFFIAYTHCSEVSALG